MDEPKVSPDGKWVWDGSEWAPIPPLAYLKGINKSPESNPTDGDGKQIVVNVSNNTALWNVCIVAITLGVLLWPHGMPHLTLLERADADCRVFGEFGLDGSFEGRCEEWRVEGRIFIFLTLLIAVICLIFINRANFGSLTKWLEDYKFRE